MINKITFWLLYFVILLVVMDMLVRLTGIYQTYAEKTGRPYSSYYGQVLPAWYHTFPPNKVYVRDQPEFKNSFCCNSLGLREKEIPVKRPDSVNRLLVLGDSFVEGDGVDYAHSMPRYLEKMLDSTGHRYEVYDAGISGSDPFYNYMLLRDKLLQYQPTHVILCFNNSDIDDHIFRGGMERFRQDGTTVYNSGPWWKPFFKYSHLFRFFIIKVIGYDETFLQKEEKKKKTLEACAAIYQCLASVKQLCDTHHVKFISVLHPFPNSFNGPQIFDDILSVTKAYPSAPVNMIDLYPGFSGYLNNDTYLQYGWKVNNHFNENGYQLFAGLLFANINEQYPGFWERP